MLWQNDNKAMSDAVEELKISESALRDESQNKIERVSSAESSVICKHLVIQLKFSSTLVSSHPRNLCILLSISIIKHNSDCPRDVLKRIT